MSTANNPKVACTERRLQLLVLRGVCHKTEQNGMNSVDIFQTSEAYVIIYTLCCLSYVRDGVIAYSRRRCKVWELAHVFPVNALKMLNL